jgi:hypothetical protein
MSKPAKVIRFVPTTIYRRRAGEWVIQREGLYAVSESVFEFARAWPAHVEKRLQSRVLHP